MNLRDWLLSQGVSSRDIQKAVREARETTETVAHASAVVEKILLKVASKVQGNKTRAVAVLGARASRVLREGAEGMLKKR